MTMYLIYLILISVKREVNYQTWQA